MLNERMWPRAMSKRESVSRRLGLTLQILSLTFLSGCQTPTGSCDPIPLKEYDEFFKAALAFEVQQMNELSPAFMFIRDGIGLRDAVRACKRK